MSLLQGTVMKLGGDDRETLAVQLLAEVESKPNPSLETLIWNARIQLNIIRLTGLRIRSRFERSTCWVSSRWRRFSTYVMSTPPIVAEEKKTPPSTLRV